MCLQCVLTLQANCYGAGAHGEAAWLLVHARMVQQNACLTCAFATRFCCVLRLSTLWPAATEALAKALEFAPEAAWPLVLEALRATQAGFLSGNDRGAPALNM